jgi:hypothetical protein
MGLCLGFSGLSLMEVIYFLTLRAWWTYKRKKIAKVVKLPDNLVATKATIRNRTGAIAKEKQERHESQEHEQMSRTRCRLPMTLWQNFQRILKFNLIAKKLPEVNITNTQKVSSGDFSFPIKPKDPTVQDSPRSYQLILGEI